MLPCCTALCTSFICPSPSSVFSFHPPTMHQLGYMNSCIHCHCCACSACRRGPCWQLFGAAAAGQLPGPGAGLPGAARAAAPAASCQLCQQAHHNSTGGVRGTIRAGVCAVICSLTALACSLKGSPMSDIGAGERGARHLLPPVSFVRRLITTVQKAFAVHYVQVRAQVQVLIDTVPVTFAVQCCAEHPRASWVLTMQCGQVHALQIRIRINGDWLPITCMYEQQ